MNEHKHWLDESSDADDLERAILRSGLEPDPSQAAREAVWTSLAQRLALAPLTAPRAAHQAVQNVSSFSRASAVGWGVGKGFVLGLAVYGAASAASALLNPAAPPRSQIAATNSATAVALVPSPVSLDPPPSKPAERLTSAPHVALSSAPPARDVSARPLLNNQFGKLPDAVTHAEAAERLPSNGASVESGAVPNTREQLPTSQLEAEARALRAARAELRRGRLPEARAMLEATQRQFSAPGLAQEREALSIEVLFKSGARAAAKARALAFLRAHPESPHAGQVRRWASED